MIRTAKDSLGKVDAASVYPFIERRISDLVYLQFYIEDENIFDALGKMSPEEAKRANVLEDEINSRLRKELGLAEL